jgi:hypothetical protein
VHRTCSKPTIEGIYLKSVRDRQECCLLNGCTRLTLIVIAGVVLNGCRGEPVAAPAAPSFAVSDGAHSGNHDFFFLAPLFKNADASPYFEPAAFDASLKPSVEICQLGVPAADGSRDCIPGDPLKRFDPSEVSVDTAAQLYQVNWHTDESNLDVLQFYRISVFIGGQLLGFADVDPVLSGSEIQNLQTGENIPLVDGRTLPIKFRIESGALCAEDSTAGDATACAAATINLAQGGGIHLSAGGEDFRFDVAPNTVATIGGQVITDLTFSLGVCDGIDVDLPTFGKCLRVSTFFTLPGAGALVFSKPLLVSMCTLNEEYHTADETRQEGLITLHQQDGPLVRALPHAEPNCASISSSPSRSGGWEWLKSLAIRVLAPTPAYAETRATHAMMLHVGAGGESTSLGTDCTASSSGPAFGGPQLTTCASSPAVRAPTAPSLTAALLDQLPRTVTEFQFALPAQMAYVDASDASRTVAAGATLPTRVRVTDWDGNPVANARVRFIEPTIDGPGIEIGTVLSNADGVAELSWTIDAGANAVVATGRGIAAPNNYPGGNVKPFMPDISLPTDQEQPVTLDVGLIPFAAVGTDVDLIVSSGTPTLSLGSVLAGGTLGLSPWTIFNRGRTDVTASITSGVYLSRDTVITQGDVLLASTVSAPSTLTAGHGVTLNASSIGIPPGTTPGVYYIGILVDATNAQTESNETNNAVMVPVTVIGATLPGLSASTSNSR